MKVVIIGGVAGGAAAARIGTLSKDTRVVMFEKGPHISLGT